MGVAAPECKITLPPDLAEALPPSVQVYSFDGEIVYHQTNDQTGYRVYSLLPVRKDERLYQRRYVNDNKLQNTHLAIEQLHGHLGTVFYFAVPEPKSAASKLSEKFMPLVKAAAKNSQVTEELFSAAEKLIPGKDSGSGPQYFFRSFAAMSLSTRQWLWVTDPRRARAIFEGDWRFVTDGIKQGWNVKKLVTRMDDHAALVTGIITHLRDEMDAKAQDATPSGRL